MPTLLLPPRLNEDTKSLRAAAERLPHWEAAVAPQWRLPTDLVLPEPIVIYGDPLFADIAASTLDLALLEPSLDFLPRLSDYLRKRTVQSITLAEARALKRRAFIKPAEDKSFPARVYSSGTELPGVDAMIPENLPVLVSDPVHWSVEYRCFVKAGEIVTFSPYFREGELAQDPSTGTWPISEEERERVTDFARSVLEETNDLPGAVVLDVGYIAEKGWAVVEANPAWASGLYGCAREAVLTVLEAAVLSRSEVGEQERRFIRERIKIEE